MQLGIAGAGLIRIPKDRVFDIKGMGIGAGIQTENNVYCILIQEGGNNSVKWLTCCHA